MEVRHMTDKQLNRRKEDFREWGKKPKGSLLASIWKRQNKNKKVVVPFWVWPQKLRCSQTTRWLLRDCPWSAFLNIWCIILNLGAQRSLHYTPPGKPGTLSNQDLSFKGKDTEPVFPEGWELEVINILVIYVLCCASPYQDPTTKDPGLASNLNDPHSACAARGFTRLP